MCIRDRYYQVQLLKSGSVVGETKSVYDTKYNFAGMITQAGSYRFRVRTVEYGTNSKSEWVNSDTWYVSAEEANALGANSGSWQKSADGTRWWWRYNCLLYTSSGQSACSCTGTHPRCAFPP